MREANAEQAYANPPLTAQRPVQHSRGRDHRFLGLDRVGEGTLGRARFEVGVLELHGHRSRPKPLATKVGADADRQPEQFALEEVVVVQVAPEGLLPAHLLLCLAGGHHAVIDPPYAVVQPGTGALPKAGLQIGHLPLLRVGDGVEPHPLQRRRESGADHRQVGQSERGQKIGFATGGNAAHAGGAGAGFRFGQFDRHLGDQPGRAGADRYRESGGGEDGVPNTMGRGLERFMTVQRFGAAHVAVPLVDARRLNNRRKGGQYLLDLLAARTAGTPGHRYAGGLRAQLERARDRHR